MGLQRFPNISALVLGPDVDIAETRSSPDDRTIRNLALQAQRSADENNCYSIHSAVASCDESTEGAAFSKMRLLVLRDMQKITSRVFTYASWFPSLTILALDECDDSFDALALDAPEKEKIVNKRHRQTMMRADFAPRLNLMRDFAHSNSSLTWNDDVLRFLSELAESEARLLESGTTDHRLSRLGIATKSLGDSQQKPVFRLNVEDGDPFPWFNFHISDLKCFCRIRPFRVNSSEDEAGIGNPNSSNEHEKAKSFRPSDTAPSHLSSSRSQLVTKSKRSDLIDTPTHPNKKARHAKSNRTMDLSNTLANFGH